MKIVMKAYAGSHLFGTNTENSDKDYKGIFIPSGSAILLGEYDDTFRTSTGNDDSRNNKDDIDVELYSLRKFYKMLRNGDTAALELLFTPDELIIEQSKDWKLIKESAMSQVSKKVTSMTGYARQQANKYGIKGSRMGELSNAIKFLKEREKSFDFSNPKLKLDWENLVAEFTKYSHVNVIQLEQKSDKVNYLPALDILGKKFDHHCTFGYVLETLKKIYKNYGQRAREAKNNNGIDWKALSHAVRVCIQGIELLNTGKITLPHTAENRQLLLNIKLGKMDYSEVSTLIEEYLEKLEKARQSSGLREEGSLIGANNDIIYFHSLEVKKYV